MEPELLKDGERMVLIVKRHWIKYVIPSFVYAILLITSLLCLILAGIAAHHAMWLSHMTFFIGLLLLVATHHWFFLTLISESATYIIITNHRVIFLRDKLLIDEQMMEYAFDKMKTVEAHKHGLLETLLRYGSLRFETGAEIPLVPHPNRVTKEIQQAMGMR